MKIDQHYRRRRCSPVTIVSDNIFLCGYSRGFLAIARFVVLLHFSYTKVVAYLRYDGQFYTSLDAEKCVKFVMKIK